MVRRLVQEQYIRLLEQQTTEGYTAAFTSGEGSDTRLIGRTAKSIHRAVKFLVDVPCVSGIQFVLQLRLTSQELIEIGIGFTKRHVDLVVLFQHVHDRLHTFLNDLAHGLVRIELRVLLQIADRVAGRPNDLALVLFLNTGDDLEQGRFTGTVQTDDTDLGAIKETQVDVLQYLFLRTETLIQSHHRKNNLLIVCHNIIRNS